MAERIRPTPAGAAVSRLHEAGRSVHTAGRVRRLLVRAWSCLAILLGGAVVAPAQGSWKTFEAGSSCSADRVSERPGGGHVVGGRVSESGAEKVYLAALDANEELEWSHSYAIPGVSSLRGLVVNASGVVGVTVMGETPTGHATGLLRFDPSGAFLGGRLLIEGIPSDLAAMGNSFLVGSTNSLAKVDGAGELQWAWHYSRFAYKSIAPVTDGRIALAGSGNTAFGRPLPTLLIVGSDGRPLRQIGRRSSEVASFTEALPLPDGDVVVVGRAAYSSPRQEVIVFRVRLDGEILWDTRFGIRLPASPGNGIVMSDSSIVTLVSAGYPSQQGGGRTGDVLLKLSSDGNLVWARVLAGLWTTWSLAGVPGSDEVVAVGANGIWGGWARLGADGGNAQAGASIYDVSVPVRSGPLCWERGVPILAEALTPFDDSLELTLEAGVEAATPVMHPCLPISCEGLSVEPGSLPGAAGLRLWHEGGFDAVEVGWDLDGDGLEDAVGNPLVADLPAGTHDVTAFARDACADPGGQSCSFSGSVVVPMSLPTWPDPMPEVSAVREAAPELRVPDPNRVVFELVPEATRYNRYGGRIGLWDSPLVSHGYTCFLNSWTDRGDGTAEFGWWPPVNSWVLVTASDDCTEGGIGINSLGIDRFRQYVDCGPVD